MTNKKKIKQKGRFFKKFRFSLLKKEIETYGFQFSFKQFCIFTLLSFMAIGLISYLAKLNMPSISILMGITFCAMPFMILAQFNQMYQINRYEMLTSYLDNIIPIFKQRPKIVSALTEVATLLDGEMKTVVNHALDYIMNNTTDVNAYENGLNLISDEFQNARLKSVHKMMVTIEDESSKNYYKSIDNMYFEVQSWISRTYTFQKDLLKRKKQLIIFSVLTMLMNCGFIFMLTTNGFFHPFTTALGYQISTTVFMIIILIIICLINIKMNGKWLIDDYTNKNATADLKAYISVKNKAKKRKPMDYMMISFFLGCAFFFYNQSQPYFATLCILSVFALSVQNKISYNVKKKRVVRAIRIEFPIWLREISLTLQNVTVVNAIEKSKETTSPIMQEEIKLFLQKFQKDPVTIHPYNDFVSGFDIPEVRSNMKILYSLQNVSSEKMDDQIHSLILRNQELLAKGESLKNEDSLSGVELLGFIPILALLFQLFINMGLTLGFMMEIMNKALETGVVG